MLYIYPLPLVPRDIRETKPELNTWTHLRRRGAAVFGQVVQGRAKSHQHDPAYPHREHVSRAQRILVVFADILRGCLDSAVCSASIPVWRAWRRGAQQSLRLRRLVLVARVGVAIRASHLVAPKDLQAEGQRHGVRAGDR